MWSACDQIVLSWPCGSQTCIAIECVCICKQRASLATVTDVAAKDKQTQLDKMNR